MLAPDTLPVPPKPVSCQIYVGTSGYSYPDWITAGFYPQSLKANQQLSEYATHFPITELNYTYYQQPKAVAIDRLRSLVPPSFLFTAKLPKTLTHEIQPQKWREEVATYRDGIAPLVQSHQLIAVLAQFGPGFDYSDANRNYLAALLEELTGLPIAVEFRNASWAHPRVYEGLEKRQITLVAVDEPPLPNLFPPLTTVTNPRLGYVRFHGRNAQGWRSGEMTRQFDYTYSTAELQDWVEEKLSQIGARTERCVVFFNTHVRAQAPRDAKRLMELLGQAGCQCQSAPCTPAPSFI